MKICNNFQVTTAPKSSTKVPADTSVFVPVLPETVPMFAQVWTHMQNFKWGWTFLLSSGSRCCCGAKTGDWWQSKGSNQPGEYFSVLEWCNYVSFFSGSSWICPILRNRLCAPWSEHGHQFHITSQPQHSLKNIPLKSAGQWTLVFCFCEHYIIQCFPLPHTIRGEFSILYGSEASALSDHLKCIHFERKWFDMIVTLNQLRLRSLVRLKYSQQFT